MLGLHFFSQSCVFLPNLHKVTMKLLVSKGLTFYMAAARGVHFTQPHAILPHGSIFYYYKFNLFRGTTSVYHYNL
jgi:hypothetical protein